MAAGSDLVVFTNVFYVIFLLFILEWITLCVGGQEDNIAYSATLQPEFAFRQQGRARYKIHDHRIRS